MSSGEDYFDFEDNTEFRTIEEQRLRREVWLHRGIVHRETYCSHYQKPGSFSVDPALEAEGREGVGVF